MAATAAAAVACALWVTWRLADMAPGVAAAALQAVRLSALAPRLGLPLVAVVHEDKDLRTFVRALATALRGGGGGRNVGCRPRCLAARSTWTRRGASTAHWGSGGSRRCGWRIRCQCECGVHSGRGGAAGAGPGVAATLSLSHVHPRARSFHYIRVFGCKRTPNNFKGEGLLMGGLVVLGPDMRCAPGVATPVFRTRADTCTAFGPPPRPPQGGVRVPGARRWRHRAGG